MLGEHRDDHGRILRALALVYCRGVGWCQRVQLVEAVDVLAPVEPRGQLPGLGVDIGHLPDITVVDVLAVIVHDHRRFHHHGGPCLTAKTVLFPNLFDKPLLARFDQPHTSSDGARYCSRRRRRCTGLVAGFVRCLVDRREPRKVRHTLADLLNQRIFGIACGHPDGNDADHLADDPIHKLLLGRDPLTGDALASQPTISRFENCATRTALYRMGRRAGHARHRAPCAAARRQGAADHHRPVLPARQHLKACCPPGPTVPFQDTKVRGESGQSRSGSNSIMITVGSPFMLPLPFSFGFEVVTDVAAAGEAYADGTYRWGGAAGTWFWIDPETDLAFVG